MKMTKRMRILSMISALALPLFAGSPVAAAPRIVAECTVILDAVTATVLFRDGICDRRVTPMSSFKLPLAMIGYDAGILADEHNPAWPYRAELDRPKRERKTVDPTIWEKDSILWYSQELTRSLGEDRFADYIDKFSYGNGDVSGDPGKDNGLTESWLVSSLVISPDEQATFLRRFLIRALPLSTEAYDLTHRITPRFEAADGWIVQGKTGSGWVGEKGKTDRSNPLGWFVGWAEKDGQHVVFARLIIGDGKLGQPGGFIARDSLLQALPEIMKDR